MASIFWASRPAAWSFFTRDCRTTSRCSSRSASLAATVQLGLGLVELPQPVRDLGQLDAQVEVVRLERDRLLERSDRLLEVAEAGQDLSQPAQALRVPIRALRERLPGRDGLGGTLEVMKVFPEIFVILGVPGSLFDGLAIECQSVVDQLRLPQQVGDLCGGHRVVGPDLQELAPDRRRGGLAIGLGLRCVAQHQRAPVA